jgi:hypothetical protein
MIRHETVRQYREVLPVGYVQNLREHALHSIWVCEGGPTPERADCQEILAEAKIIEALQSSQARHSCLLMAQRVCLEGGCRRG